MRRVLRRPEGRDHVDHDIKPPRGFLTITEGLRAGFEASHLAFWFACGSTVPAGDGHPVLVLPGFATDDAATFLLRAFLKKLGYDVRAWDLGWNLDHRTTGVDGRHVSGMLRSLHKEKGEKVSIIGWSLGGVIARETARKMPRCVRQVITLGSPFTGNPSASALRHLYQLLTGSRLDSRESHRRSAAGAAPLPVPSTSIFSKADGLTAWKNCIGEIDHQNENIEVRSSHLGMVMNPVVFDIVADRLAQPVGRWRPFGRGSKAD